MGLTEETVSSYEEYKAKVDTLEKGPAPKARVVFCFEPAEGHPELQKTLATVRKDGSINGVLIHVKITKTEFANAACPYRKDAKFKVPAIPFLAVFNQKTTLGRNWIHKTLEANKVGDETKLGNMFK